MAADPSLAHTRRMDVTGDLLVVGFWSLLATFASCVTSGIAMAVVRTAKGPDPKRFFSPVQRVFRWSAVTAAVLFVVLFAVLSYGMAHSTMP